MGKGVLRAAREATGVPITVGNCSGVKNKIKPIQMPIIPGLKIIFLGDIVPPIS